MPEYVRGRPEGIRCMVEGAIKACGLFVLIHDGGKSDDPYYKREGMPEQSQRFARVYRMVLDGKPVNTWIRFNYDLRKQWADVQMSTHDMAIMDKIMKAETDTIVEHE